MLLLFLTGTGLPAQPRQRIIPRLPAQDEDEDEALLCVMALLAAHRRAGTPEDFDDLTK